MYMATACACNRSRLHTLPEARIGMVHIGWPEPRKPRSPDALIPFKIADLPE